MSIYYFTCPEWAPRCPPLVDQFTEGGDNYLYPRAWNPRQCEFRKTDGTLWNRDQWLESSDAVARQLKRDYTCTTHGTHPVVYRRHSAAIRFRQQRMAVLNEQVAFNANPDTHGNYFWSGERIVAFPPDWPWPMLTTMDPANPRRSQYYRAWISRRPAPPTTHGSW